MKLTLTVPALSASLGPDTNSGGRRRRRRRRRIRRRMRRRGTNT